MADKQNIRSRAIRLAASALLRENFSEPEFQELLAVLDATFAEDLRSSLAGFNSPKEASTTPDLPSANRSHGNPVVDLIYDQVRAKRMSRQRLLAHLDSVAPGLIGRHIAHMAPVLSIIEAFIERASETQVRHLLGRLIGATGMMEDDPYLSGITRREDK